MSHNINRRKFLKVTGLAAIGAAFAGAIVRKVRVTKQQIVEDPLKYQDTLISWDHASQTGEFTALSGPGSAGEIIGLEPIKNDMNRVWNAIGGDKPDMILASHDNFVWWRSKVKGVNL